DISSVIDVKLRAIACHASQIEHTPYTARVLGLNAARSWSLPTEVSHAEAFHRWPRRDAPLASLLDAAMRPALSEGALPPAAELVSVIVRTVNRPVYLREAIRSVAAQAHARIELVLVVDGDEDFAGIVAEEAVGAIEAIQTVHTIPPRGRARAANTGLDAATGSFLCFLDDDDWLLPHHVSTLVASLRTTQAPACYSTVEGIRVERAADSVAHVFNEPFDAVRLGFRNFMPIHSVMFRKSVVERGCRFDESLDLFEDWHFWLQLARLGDFVHIDEITAKYRVSESSGVGIPGGLRDPTEGLRRFVEASRDVWTTDQLRHLCASGAQAEALQQQERAIVLELDRTRQAAANAEARATMFESDFAAQADALKAERQALRAAFDGEIALWRARYELVVNSRSWRLARALTLPVRIARAAPVMQRTLQEQLRRHSLRSVVRRGWRIFRSEGLSGVKARLRGTTDASRQNAPPAQAPPVATQTAQADQRGECGQR
ncbi:MAG: glycosyltransferase, partial [Halothiobacillaceae bacterium]